MFEAHVTSPRRAFQGLTLMGALPMMTGGVFDKLKGLIGGGGDATDEAAPARPAAGPRRPATPRRRMGAAKGPERAAASLAPAPETANEIACPNCGEPMLAGWGTTCGKCRPTMVSPKTMFGGESASLAGATGMVLGWLVALRSSDKACVGQLFELDKDAVVLSRAGAFTAAGVGLVEIGDEYMSGGHSLLRRPRTLSKTDAFTLRDRWDPGPSANGTFVNSRKLAPDEEMKLADGDIIKVGSTELLFKSLWLPPSGRRAP